MTADAAAPSAEAEPNQHDEVRTMLDRLARGLVAEPPRGSPIRV